MDQYTVSVRLEKKDIRADNEIRHQFDYFGRKRHFLSDNSTFAHRPTSTGSLWFADLNLNIVNSTKLENTNDPKIVFLPLRDYNDRHSCLLTDF